MVPRLDRPAQDRAALAPLPLLGVVAASTFMTTPIYQASSSIQIEREAIKVVSTVRSILGGDGVTAEYPIMRHMMNLESVITYEGTHDIHLLITGMDITGISAFR